MLELVGGGSQGAVIAVEGAVVSVPHGAVVHIELPFSYIIKN